VGKNLYAVFACPDSTQELFGKRATAEIETRLIDVNESLGRLEAIREGFRPEFLTLPTKFAVGTLEAIEKAGFELAPEDRQKITEFETFRRNAIEGLNLEIQRLTGAQLSQFEAGRLRRGFPDPEEDAPTQFKAKLDSTIKSLRASAFRLQALRRFGLAGDITSAIEKQFPLGNYEPPSDESDAEIIDLDDEGNPIFERPDGSQFKMVL